MPRGRSLLSHEDSTAAMTRKRKSKGRQAKRRTRCAISTARSCAEQPCTPTGEAAPPRARYRPGAATHRSCDGQCSLDKSLCVCMKMEPGARDHSFCTRNAQSRTRARHILDTLQTLAAQTSAGSRARPLAPQTSANSAPPCDRAESPPRAAVDTRLSMAARIALGQCLCRA